MREHTCECDRLVYELCAAGGVVFVRRRYREDKKITVWESEWLRTAEGMGLWMAILTGSAR